MYIWDGVDEAHVLLKRRPAFEFGRAERAGQCGLLTTLVSDVPVEGEVVLVGPPAHRARVPTSTFNINHQNIHVFMFWAITNNNFVNLRKHYL